MGKGKVKVTGIFKTTDQVKETIIPVAIGAGLRAAGVMAGFYGFDPIRSKLPDGMKPMTGIFMAAVGVGLEAYSDNEYLTSIAQGISAAGAARFVIDTNPAMKKMTGVSFAPVVNSTPLKGLDAQEVQLPATEPNYTDLVAAINHSIAGIGEIAENEHTIAGEMPNFL